MSDIDVSVKLTDAARVSELRSIPKFVGFLSSAEVSEGLKVLKGCKHGVFGGYDGAERSYVGIFPDWCEASEEQYPITPITFTFREVDSLSHRDFLGSLMALGLERSTVGDILVEKGRAVAFVSEDIADYIISQLSKVGRVGVVLKKGYEGSLPEVGGFLEASATVASLRLDCVIGALTGKSRNSAQEFISSGLVSVNSLAAEKSTTSIKDGDVLSIRGFGRFKMISTGETSKKGRVILRWKKYI